MAYKFNQYQEAWLKDLETTKAKQCAGYLTDKGGYCCLGRAYVANGGIVVACEYEGHHRVLGPIMIKNLKLRDEVGSFGESCLASLNDDDGLSFKEIATFIRANADKVFTDG